MLAIAPHTVSILGRAQDATGDYEGAITSLEWAVELESRSPVPLAWLGAAYAMAGHEERALAILAELEQRANTEAIVPVCFAYVYAGLHRKNEALESFERAFQARKSQIYWLKVIPSFDFLRHDRRYWNLVQRLGLIVGEVVLEVMAPEQLLNEGLDCRTDL